MPRQAHSRQSRELRPREIGSESQRGGSFGEILPLLEFKCQSQCAAQINNGIIKNAVVRLVPGKSTNRAQSEPFTDAVIGGESEQLAHVVSIAFVVFLK